MSRYIKNIDDYISIAYGYDKPLQGYFLQIYDNRLEWKDNNSDEENDKAEDADPSGDGQIESYATNNFLSDNVMGRGKILERLHEYDINPTHLHAITLDLPF